MYVCFWQHLFKAVNVALHSWQLIQLAFVNRWQPLCTADSLSIIEQAASVHSMGGLFYFKADNLSIHDSLYTAGILSIEQAASVHFIRVAYIFILKLAILVYS
jgi:hypothetical protein